MLKKILLIIFLLLPITVAQAVDAPLLITEVQITGGEGKTTNDYVKIYNNTDNVLDLAGYRLVKRTKSGATDTTIKSWTDPTPLNPRGFYLWANSADGFATAINADCATTGTLANDNSLALRQGPADSGLIIDALSWGETGVNSLGLDKHFDNPLNGKITIDANSAPAPAEQAPIAKATGGGVTYCALSFGQVVINELLSAPGEDESEWLELYNKCDLPTQVDGWTIVDGAGTETKLTGIIDKFLVIESPKGQLNNAGDLITLKNSAGDKIDEVLYGVWEKVNGAPAPTAGFSLARLKDGADSDEPSDWALTQNPTKGQSNIISGAKTLTETTESKTAVATSSLMISEILPNPLGADDQTSLQAREFIELYNPSNQDIALKDWRLVVGEQAAYVFNDGSIKSQTYFTLERKISRLKLRNDKETVKLYKPNTSRAWQSVSYSQAPEGLSYSYNLSEQDWLWSLGPTPGAANSFIKPNQAPQILIYAPTTAEPGETIVFDASDSFDPENAELNYAWEFSDGVKLTGPFAERLITEATNLSVVLSVSDGNKSIDKKLNVKIGSAPVTLPDKQTATINLALAEPVSTKNISSDNSALGLKGIVVVPPGVFAKQYFYLAPLDGEEKAADEAIQVYNYKADFPELKQGDLLQIKGELYPIQNETRLKIASSADIVILDHDYILVDKSLGPDQFKPSLHNQIVTVSGRLLEKKSSQLVLASGGQEIIVDIKKGTNIKTTDLVLEKTYQITGLAKASADSVKLWPRSPADIILSEETAPAVLGEKINATDTAETLTPEPEPIMTSQRRQQTLEYLLLTACGLIIGLIILLFKVKK